MLLFNVTKEKGFLLDSRNDIVYNPIRKLVPAERRNLNGSFTRNVTVVPILKPITKMILIDLRFY